jgi:hypothetical protein
VKVKASLRRLLPDPAFIDCSLVLAGAAVLFLSLLVSLFPPSPTTTSYLSLSRNKTLLIIMDLTTALYALDGAKNKIATQATENAQLATENAHQVTEIARLESLIALINQERTAENAQQATEIARLKSLNALINQERTAEREQYASQIKAEKAVSRKQEIHCRALQIQIEGAQAGFQRHVSQLEERSAQQQQQISQLEAQLPGLTQHNQVPGTSSSSRNDVDAMDV